MSMFTHAAHMFTKNADHIVVVGLGGLGRFICSWMMENDGAWHLTVISRSGAGTKESRDAMSTMKVLVLLSRTSKQTPVIEKWFYRIYISFAVKVPSQALSILL